MPESTGKFSRNGLLTYKANGVTSFHPIWIMEISQSHSLSGSSYQSRLTKAFYPRSYAPGTTSITGRCSSQLDYQKLARFVRGHQQVMVDTPTNINFTRMNPNGIGFQSLMKLSIPDEGIIWAGFIPKFTISKKGIFDPAPQYSLDFITVHDSHSTNVVYISNALNTTFFTGDPVLSGSDKDEVRRG